MRSRPGPTLRPSSRTESTCRWWGQQAPRGAPACPSCWLLDTKPKTTWLSSAVLLTSQPTFPLSLPQQTFKYLKTAVRIHLDVLSSRFKVPSSLSHSSRWHTINTLGHLTPPSSKCHPICQNPGSVVASRMKCNAPDVVWTLPSREGHSIISPPLGSVLPLVQPKTVLAFLPALPHCWLPLHSVC